MVKLIYDEETLLQKHAWCRLLYTKLPEVHDETTVITLNLILSVKAGSRQDFVFFKFNYFKHDYICARVRLRACMCSRECSYILQGYGINWYSSVYIFIYVNLSKYFLIHSSTAFQNHFSVILFVMFVYCWANILVFE